MTSPVGDITLAATDKGLCAVYFGKSKKSYFASDAVLERNPGHKIIAAAKKQLLEYFAGKRRAFDVPIDIRGTVFQMKAWKELQKIPYAQTISYSEQAKRIGDVKKARPAGMANGRNPISIIIPCHRVIGSSGDLTGYASGLKIKAYLLGLEKKHAA
jgi:methylated-DNA-[protein]-cysteine S-methyltransferase